MHKNPRNIQSATVLPPAPDIVNERPKGMDMKEYKALRSQSNKAIKERTKKGFLVFLSQEFLLDEMGKIVGKRFRTGQTFQGSTKMLQLV